MSCRQGWTAKPFHADNDDRDDHRAARRSSVQALSAKPRRRPEHGSRDVRGGMMSV